MQVKFILIILIFQYLSLFKRIVITRLYIRSISALILFLFFDFLLLFIYFLLLFCIFMKTKVSKVAFNAYINFHTTNYF